MKMLEECIDKIFDLSTIDEENKELFKSIYYHLSDYKDILDKVIDLNNEIGNISKRWNMINKP